MNLLIHKLKEYLGRGNIFFYVLLLVSGFVLRIFLSLHGTFRWDFDTWKKWAYSIDKVGFARFYDEVNWCDYMPGYLYVLWLLQKIHSTFPQFSDEILFKLPANIADLGISLLIFFALKRMTNVKSAMLASLVYFFNPASLSNSTFWGQVDSLHVFFLLISILLGVSEHFVTSSVFAVIAFMIKPQSIVIFPIIGFLIIRDVVRRRKEDRAVLRTFLLAIKIISALIVTIVLITLPFIWDELTENSVLGVFKETVIFIKERFYKAYSGYEYTSVNAFNFWGWIHGMWKSDQIKFLNITYQRWGAIVFGIFYALILCLLLTSDLIKQYSGCKEFRYRIFQAITLIFLALFLFVTRAHERHLLPAVMFFTLIAFHSSWYLFFYAVISLSYVVNMSYAYLEEYPILFFSSSMIKPFIPVIVIFLSVVFLLVFKDFIRDTIWFYRGRSS